MLELRRLFALLVASEKRYVDPSAAVDWLKKVLDGGGTDSQQDISEFTHKVRQPGAGVSASGDVNPVIRVVLLDVSSRGLRYCDNFETIS